MSAERAMQLWPELRHAVQPKPLERRNGSFSFSVAKEWAALVQRVERGEFRLRAPVQSPAGLLAFKGYGGCLLPLLDHDYMWIDPSLEPCDGDLVVVELGERTVETIVENWRRNPATYAANVAMYGERPGRIATKWLRALGSDYWLVTRESMIPLAPHPRLAPDGSRILGVVRYVERNGKPIYDGSGEPIAHAIVPEAVDEVAQTQGAGPVTVSATGDTQTAWADEVTLAVEPADVIEVSISLTAVVQFTVISGSPVPGDDTRFAIAYRDSPSGTPVEIAPMYMGNNSNDQHVSGTAVVSGLAADTYDFGFLVVAEETGGLGTYSVHALDYTIAVTRIRR